MKNNKYFLAAIVGGVVYFLLGWLIYGMLLMTFMKENSGLPADIYSKVFKPDTDINMGMLVLSCLLEGFLAASILSWSGVTSAGSGFTKMAIAGLLIVAYFDTTFYSVSNMFTMKSMIVDIISGTIIAAIGGAVVGWILGKGK